MRAHFGLPSVVAEETEGKPPIHVKFEIPYFTVSGIQVRHQQLLANDKFFCCVRDNADNDNITIVHRTNISVHK